MIGGCHARKNMCFFKKTLVTGYSPLPPFYTNGPRISYMVTLENKTAAAPVGPPFSKRRFCWGRLSPAAARPPGSPLTVSRWRRSQGSGGRGWLCGCYPGTLCLRWCSADKDTNRRSKVRHTHTTPTVPVHVLTGARVFGLPASWCAALAQWRGWHSWAIAWPWWTGRGRLLKSSAEGPNVWRERPRGGVRRDKRQTVTEIKPFHDVLQLL